MRKVFVTVLSEHAPDGRCKPISITWEDGKVYEIDRILDVRQAASLKAGGTGIRYTCRIRGKETYLFDDEGKWFVEAK
jgi:hypothetical protein